MTMDGSPLGLAPRSPQFWWVNQGKTYATERTGGYLWAALETKAGHSVKHHSDLARVRQGDFLIHFANGHVRALGVAHADAETALRPEELVGDWQPEGNIARVTYHELPQPLAMDRIPSDLRALEDELGPLDKNLGAKEGYIFPISARLFSGVAQAAAPSWPEMPPIFTAQAGKIGAARALHTMMRWSADFEAQTIELHQAIARQRGSVWWGKLNRPIPASRVARLKNQIAAGVGTRAYLFSQSVNSWHVADVVEVSDDPKTDDDPLVPSYYRGQGAASTYLRLRDIRPYSRAEAEEELRLESDPDDRQAISGAISGRGSILWVIDHKPPGPVERDDRARRPSPESFTAVALRERAQQAGLLLPKDLFAQLVAALKADKHVILTGPPGTGKTSLATLVSQLAVDCGLARGYLPTTATSDWTTFDTIGGLHPVAGGLEFQGGLFVQAIQKGEWLLIDELNRSNFDRAFGQLFTVLSGQPVTLAYKQPGAALPLALVPHDVAAPPGTDPLEIPEWWRIVATMNVFDKTLLFTMSYALMRRFAFIEVPAPDELTLGSLIDEVAGAGSGAARVIRRLQELAQIKQFGAAPFLDAAKYARERLREEEVPDGQLLFECFYSYFLPQFEGVDDPGGQRLRRLLRRLAGAGLHDAIDRTLRETLGVESLPGDINPDEAELGEDGEAPL